MMSNFAGVTRASPGWIGTGLPLLRIIVSVFVVRLVASTSELTSQQIREELNRCGGAAEQLINGCLQPILGYANDIQRETSSTEHFSLKGGDVFKQLCKHYAQFKGCTEGVDCSSIAIRAVDASYGYMCGKGYGLFEEHATCFAEVENQPEYVYCKRRASNALDDALKIKSDNEGADVSDMYFHRLCDVMEEYLRCCRPLVQQTCGAKAWSLVSRLTIDSLEVTMPSCDLKHAHS